MTARCVFEIHVGTASTFNPLCVYLAIGFGAAGELVSCVLRRVEEQQIVSTAEDVPAPLLASRLPLRPSQ